MIFGWRRLFSNLEDSDAMARAWLHNYKRDPISREFASRAVRKSQGDWGLGVMVPSRPVSTGGKKISESGFGFPGFTGPSIGVNSLVRFPFLKKLNLNS
jgi:hypothetical protein